MPTQVGQLEVIQLGHIDYQKAWNYQKANVKKRLQEQIKDTLIFCSHPPVVTFGRKTQNHEIQQWKGETYSIERGGRATYHGPGQCIVYPIINLKNKGQNVTKFLWALEKATIMTLSHYQVTATGNPQRVNPQLTGVWVNHKKIASIGIALKKWVSYHGLAINLYADPLAFQGINPCGLSAQKMTSLEELLMGQTIVRQEFENHLAQYLCQYLH